MKKYELTEQTKGIFVNTISLRRIRALRDIPFYGIKAGDLGGWVESEKNLSQDGDCWVADNARVGDNARVAQRGVINSTQDYLVVGPIGSRSAYTTFYRAGSDIWVCCGCFNGSINDFAKRVRETHDGNRHAQEYIETVDYVRSVFERRDRYSHTDSPHA